MTDVVILGLSVTELLVIGLSVVAVAFVIALVRVRRLRVAWQQARAVEETVSLEDLHRRIALYVPSHVEVEAPSRAATPHFLTDSGIHTNEKSAEWAASFRERAGMGGEDAPVAVTSDPDEDLAKWRHHALTLIADAPTPEPPPATLELGWTVQSAMNRAAPVAPPEPAWTIGVRRGRPVIIEAAEKQAEIGPTSAFFELPSPAELATPDQPAIVADAALAAITIPEPVAATEPEPTGDANESLVGPDVAAPNDLAWTEIAERTRIFADQELVPAEPDVAMEQPVPAEPVAAEEPLVAAQQASHEPAAVTDEVPELSALVRALDALRSASVPDAAYPANAAFVTAPEPPVDSSIPGAAELVAPRAAEVIAPHPAEIVTSRVPEIARPTAAAPDELPRRRGMQGRRRRMVRRRPVVRPDETRDDDRSITVVAPSRARDGAEVRLRLDLDSDGLAALLQALEQGKIDDVPVQPGLVVIPGGKSARRAN